MIQWCLKEATAKGLRPCDFWGGLALDEMKIQVHAYIARNTLFHQPRRLCLHWCLMDMFCIIYVSLQENLEMTVKKRQA